MTFQGWPKEQIRLTDGREVEATCPVIVSASRATDIPAFFAKWFSNRLQAGYLRWTNPFNANQVQVVSFKYTRVIVFWSKNPQPLLKYLPQLDEAGINYYVQFTLNNYEKERLEPHVPPLAERIAVFKQLSDQLGPKRVIWRFDPLMLSPTLSVDALLQRIQALAPLLHHHTRKLVISFADISKYPNVQTSLARQTQPYCEFTSERIQTFAARLAEVNQEWGLEIATCAESVDLSEYGIKPNRCIDDALMIDLFKSDRDLMRFLGYDPDLFSNSPRPYLKDKGQRKACGCIVSKDIGMYNTCPHLCAYCYANASRHVVENNLKRHNPDSETLIG